MVSVDVKHHVYLFDRVVHKIFIFKGIDKRKDAAGSCYACFHSDVIILGVWFACPGGPEVLTGNSSVRP